MPNEIFLMHYMIQKSEQKIPIFEPLVFRIILEFYQGKIVDLDIPFFSSFRGMCFDPVQERYFVLEVEADETTIVKIHVLNKDLKFLEMFLVNDIEFNDDSPIFIHCLDEKIYVHTQNNVFVLEDHKKEGKDEKNKKITKYTLDFSKKTEILSASLHNEKFFLHTKRCIFVTDANGKILDRLHIRAFSIFVNEKIYVSDENRIIVYSLDGVEETSVSVRRYDNIIIGVCGNKVIYERVNGVYISDLVEQTHQKILLPSSAEVLLCIPDKGIFFTSEYQGKTHGKITRSFVPLCF